MSTDYSEQIFQSIDTIISQRLKEVSFDKTEICEIISQDKDNVNKYWVSNGSLKYEAYSIDENRKYPMADRGQIQVILEEMLLLEGEYTLDIAFHDEYGAPYDYIRRIMKFNVYSDIKDVGVFRIKHKYIQGQRC